MNSQKNDIKRMQKIFNVSVKKAQKKSLEKNNFYTYRDNDILYIKFAQNTSFFQKIKHSLEYKSLHWT